MLVYDPELDYWPMDTYPFPWQSSPACQRPLPTHRWVALCTGQERCHGTGGPGELSERYGWRRGWERGACTWRSGARTWRHTNASVNGKESFPDKRLLQILCGDFNDGLRTTKQAHSFWSQMAERQQDCCSNNYSYMHAAELNLTVQMNYTFMLVNAGRNSHFSDYF